MATRTTGSRNKSFRSGHTESSRCRQPATLCVTDHCVFLADGSPCDRLDRSAFEMLSPILMSWRLGERRGKMGTGYFSVTKSSLSPLGRITFHRRAGGDKIPGPVGVADAPNPRPELALTHPGRGEGRPLAAGRVRAPPRPPR